MIRIIGPSSDPAFTCDLWRSRTKREYFTLTMHWINVSRTDGGSEWKLCNRILGSIVVTTASIDHKGERDQAVVICCIHVLMCFVVVICGCDLWLLFATNSSSLLQSATMICCFHMLICSVVVICGCYLWLVIYCWQQQPATICCYDLLLPCVDMLCCCDMWLWSMVVICCCDLLLPCVDMFCCCDLCL